MQHLISKILLDLGVYCYFYLYSVIVSQDIFKLYAMLHMSKQKYLLSLKYSQIKIHLFIISKKKIIKQMHHHGCRIVRFFNLLIKFSRQICLIYSWTWQLWHYTFKTRIPSKATKEFQLFYLALNLIHIYVYAIHLVLKFNLVSRRIIGWNSSLAKSTNTLKCNSIILYTSVHYQQILHFPQFKLNFISSWNITMCAINFYIYIFFTGLYNATYSYA